MTRGFLLGKFMPPHKGHMLLCETARQMVDRLTILVCSLPDDPVPGDLRRAWMSELFPDCIVIGYDRVVPQLPEDDPEFWNIWRDIARAAHPDRIDMVFASESYGLRLASELDARFVPVDIDRLAVPVSATGIRTDPAAHWRYIPEPVRPWFLRHVVLHGPESTGKSTLAARLADHFGTLAVPEYGRTYCETFGTNLVPEDLVRIMEGHVAMTAALKRQSGPLLISDTDPLMTAAWSRMLFGHRLDRLDAFDEPAHLYLLMADDLPWLDDGTRFFGGAEERRRFFELSRDELDRRALPWVLISGDGEARFEAAIAAIRAGGLA